MPPQAEDVEDEVDDFKKTTNKKKKANNMAFLAFRLEWSAPETLKTLILKGIFSCFLIG